jgi:hypothetical protein
MAHAEGGCVCNIVDSSATYKDYSTFLIKEQKPWLLAPGPGGEASGHARTSNPTTSMDGDDGVVYTITALADTDDGCGARFRQDFALEATVHPTDPTIGGFQPAYV